VRERNGARWARTPHKKEDGREGGRDMIEGGADVFSRSALERDIGC
jgi:hypothetical protein